MTTCSIDGCEKPRKARGWCGAHWARWRKHGDPLTGGPLTRSAPNTGPCSIDDCDKPSRARGWCIAHWDRWRKYGDPLGRGEQTRYASPEESFVGRAAWDGEHLIWTGTTDESGHGAIAVERKMIKAHRYAWERERGAIPDGMVIDHRCHTPACVLVEHLRLATPQQNAQNRRGATKGRDLPRGVYRSGRRYQASVRDGGVLHYLGTFDSPELASAAASEARRVHFGQYAGNA